MYLRVFIGLLLYSQISYGQSTNSDSVMIVKNIDIAVLEDMAIKGMAQAQYELAQKYDLGQGIAKNKKQAFYWYYKSAEQGYLDAQCDLASMYYQGHGTSQNYAKAFKWYSTAAKQGHAKSQNNLGYMLEQGISVDKNLNEAIHWYEKSASQGNVLAQSALAMIYSKGAIGIDADFNKAAPFFLKAAKQGHAFSQLIVGFMYYEGNTVSKNLALARAWFCLSAKNGEPNAIENCDSSTAQMTKEELESSNKILKSFLIGIYDT